MVLIRASALLACLALVSAAPAPAPVGDADAVSPRDNGMLLRYKLGGCGSRGPVPGHCWSCKCGVGGVFKCGDECRAAGCGCVPR